MSRCEGCAFEGSRQQLPASYSRFFSKIEKRLTILFRTPIIEAIKEWWIDAIALVGSVVGSILVASNTGLTLYGYICFLVASFASIVILRKSHVSKSMLFLNWYYVVINCVGVVRYMVKV